MASQVPLFFYAPSWDYPPPPAGPIKLGNVIASLETPEQPLYTAPMPTESEVISSEKKHVQFSHEKARKGNFAIVTKFLSIFGVGVDVGADVGKSNTESYTFDSITTTQFIPTTSFLQEKCIDASYGVRRWLELSRYRKPLYVITGLKIVKGGKTGETMASREHGAHVEATVDGTIWSGGAVPVSGGPELGGRRSNSAGMKWEDGSDFVLAFRVQRLKVAKHTNQIAKQEFYKKGAHLGRWATQRVGDEFVFENDDLTVHPLDWEGEVMEGDELVAMAVPKARPGVHE